MRKGINRLILISCLSAAPAVAQDGGTPAKPLNTAEWVTADDYPAAVKRKGESGTVAFALSIDANGMVAACEVTLSSRVALLDETTCRLLTERARFTPARDAAGNAVAGTFSSKFHWSLGPPPVSPMASWQRVTYLHIGPNGKVLDCREERKGPVPEATGSICWLSSPSAFTIGLRGGIGQGNRLVISEMTQNVAGMTTYTEIGRGPDRRITGLNAATFEAWPSGKVKKCAAAGQDGFAVGLPSPCTYGLGPFMPFDGKAPRKIRYSIITSIEK
ncbi:MAG: energy transducer TonB [Sphingomonas sp.]|uniref:energy transducer TonB n=1 Tax=Sphingomonas sp. TaxID=28214 RepID=UPI003F80DD0C